MSYYFISITIMGFKEAINQNVDIFWDNVPCSSKGTIHGMPHVNPYAFRVEFQVIRGTYSALVTDPTLYGMGGGFLKKSLELSKSLRPWTNTYSMVHTVVSPKAEQGYYKACL